MNLSNSYTRQEWRSILQRVDSAIHSAIEERIKRGAVSISDLASGFSELALLREGREPDYSVPGIEIAYAFKYLPRRVSCLLGALARISDRGVPARVLDIGAGSDAASLALDVWSPGLTSPIAVTCLEPSNSMRSFGQRLKLTPRVQRRWLSGGFEALYDGHPEIPLASFDLIVMSACLPYADTDWIRLARTVGELTAPPASVIVIEPNQKQWQFSRLVAGLRQTGYYAIQEMCCHDLDPIITSEIKLPNTTAAVLAGCRPLTPEPVGSSAPRAVPLSVSDASDHRVYSKCCCSTKLNQRMQSLGAQILNLPNLPSRVRSIVGDAPYPVTSWNSNPGYRESIAICTEG